MAGGLTFDEVNAFADVFAELASARHVLETAGLNRRRHPEWVTAELFWSEVSRVLAAGVMADGRRRLMTAARELYPDNPVFVAGAPGAPGSAGTAGTAGRLAATAATAATSDGVTRPWVRRPWTVPQRSAVVVPRPVLTAQLLAAVTATDDRAVEVTTGVEGAGGFGKTTLAGEVARHSRVEARFPGGVLWVTVGETASGAELAGLVGGLCRVLSGDVVTESDPMVAGGVLGSLLEEREPVLLVVDDVWRSEQLAPFLVGGRGCRRLVTTRNAGVVPPGSRTVVVDEMTAAETTRTLAAGLGDVPAAAVDGLVRWTGRWPVLLGLVNAALVELVAEGASVAEAVDWVQRRLAVDGPVAFDDPDALHDPVSRSRAVRATVETSVGLLSDGQRAHYLDLAAFPEDSDVPVDVLGLLWGATGMPAGEVERFRSRLVRLRLVSGRWVDGQRSVRLHDVLRSYLRTAGGAQRVGEVQRRLVDAARATLAGDEGDEGDERDEGDEGDERDEGDEGGEDRGGGERGETGAPSGSGSWWALPAGTVGDYLSRNLVFHLLEAGLADEAAATACDLRWVAAKTARFGSSVGVEADLARIDTSVASALGRALGQAAHLLTPLDPPGSLAATLVSRLTGVPGLDEVVAAYRPYLPRQRLEPCWPVPDLPHPALRRTLTGHTSPVNTVVFSPDGSRLASASDDGTVRVWDVATGVGRVLSGHGDVVSGVVFSPDGTQLASTSHDATVRVWDATTGTCRVLFDHPGPVRAVVFSPDGRQLASTSADDSVRLWDAATGSCRTLPGHTGFVNAVVFSPDGTHLASGADDESVRVWDVASGTGRMLSGHTGPVNAVVFSPDGSRLASASVDRTVRLWNVTTGTSRILAGHTSWVHRVVFAPDGTHLASTCEDSTVRIWDTTADDTSLVLSGHTHRVSAVVFSPDGSRLASASVDRTVRVWDVAASTGPSPARRTSWVNAVAFSPAGSRLASASDDRTVRVWDVGTGACRTLSGHSGSVYAVAFSPDGTWLASASDDRTVRVWNVATGTGRMLAGHVGSVYAVAFSPDGSRLASASFDRTVRVWDVADGAARVLAGHTDRVSAVVFSPDGSQLASASSDRTVRVWDLTAGTDAGTGRVFTGHAGSVGTVVFSPDGSRLASAWSDRRVRVWDVATGTGRFLSGHTDGVFAVVFSPDGRRLASAAADRTVRVWDLATGGASVLSGHSDAVSAVVFSPDGTRLVSVSHDRTVRLWDVASASPVAAIRTAEAVTVCAWHPTSSTVAAGGHGGTYAFLVHN